MSFDWLLWSRLSEQSIILSMSVLSSTMLSALSRLPDRFVVAILKMANFLEKRYNSFCEVGHVASSLDRPSTTSMIDGVLHEVDVEEAEMGCRAQF